MQISNKTYDTLKWISLTFLPALTVFVGVVLHCFDVPCTDIVITIMTAFDAFLGTILGVNSLQYKKDGDMLE